MQKPSQRFTPLLVALGVALLPTGIFVGEKFDTFVRIGLLIVGAYSVQRSRRSLWISALIVAPVLAIQVVDVAGHGLLVAQVALFSALLFLIYVLTVTLRGVMTAQTVDRDILVGGISVFLLLGFCWSLAYALADLMSPGSFSLLGKTEAQIPYTYFSFITLTSIGYGDIVPLTAGTRYLAMLEAIVGQLYLTIFIGRLIGISFDGPHPKVAPEP